MIVGSLSSISVVAARAILGAPSAGGPTRLAALPRRGSRRISRFLVCFEAPRTTLRVRVMASFGSQETSVCADGSRQGSFSLDAVLTGLQDRVASFTPAPVTGALIYFQTGQVWPALVLMCLAGRPTRAVQRVTAEWIELLAPPRRWRRPRRRGS